METELRARAEEQLLDDAKSKIRLHESALEALEPLADSDPMYRFDREDRDAHELQLAKGRLLLALLNPKLPAYDSPDGWPWQDVITSLQADVSILARIDEEHPRYDLRETINDLHLAMQGLEALLQGVTDDTCSSVPGSGADGHATVEPVVVAFGVMDEGGVVARAQVNGLLAEDDGELVPLFARAPAKKATVWPKRPLIYADTPRENAEPVGWRHRLHVLNTVTEWFYRDGAENPNFKAEEIGRREVQPLYTSPPQASMEGDAPQAGRDSEAIPDDDLDVEECLSDDFSYDDNF